VLRPPDKKGNSDTRSAWTLSHDGHGGSAPSTGTGSLRVGGAVRCARVPFPWSSWADVAAAVVSVSLEDRQGPSRGHKDRCKPPQVGSASGWTPSRSGVASWCGRGRNPLVQASHPTRLARPARASGLPPSSPSSTRPLAHLRAHDGCEALDRELLSARAPWPWAVNLHEGLLPGSRPPHHRSRSWGRCSQRRGQWARTRFSQASRSLTISCLLVSWNSSWRAAG
jgi:hypothetical protein